MASTTSDAFTVFKAEGVVPIRGGDDVVLNSIHAVGETGAFSQSWMLSPLYNDRVAQAVTPRYDPVGSRIDRGHLSEVPRYCNGHRIDGCVVLATFWRAVD